MKKEALWAHYAARNPQFEGEGSVTLSKAGLRKLFDQTYDTAHSQGYVNGKAAAAMAAGKPPRGAGDILSSVFP